MGLNFEMCRGYYVLVPWEQNYFANIELFNSGDMLVKKRRMYTTILFLYKGIPLKGGFIAFPYCVQPLLIEIFIVALRCTYILHCI
jgi:hypothetical protein